MKKSHPILIHDPTSPIVSQRSFYMICSHQDTNKAHMLLVSNVLHPPWLLILFKSLTCCRNHVGCPEDCPTFRKPLWYHLVCSSVPHISCKWKLALELWRDSYSAFPEDNFIWMLWVSGCTTLGLHPTWYANCSDNQQVQGVTALSVHCQVLHKPFISWFLSSQSLAWCKHCISFLVANWWFLSAIISSTIIHWHLHKEGVLFFFFF